MEQALIPFAACDSIPAQAALVFAPHPDDEIFGCGATLARLAARGVPVRTIVVTDGSACGGEDGQAALVAAREAESCAAATLMGLPAPEFWRLPDRGLQYGEALVVRLCDAIRAQGADLVFAPSPHEMHPDHSALAMAAIEAVRRIGAKLRLALYEIGVPLRPNTLVDIGDLLERKRAAMRCFVSQLAFQRYDEQIEALNRYRAYTLPAGVVAAEAFEVLAAEDIARDNLSVFVSEHRRRHSRGIATIGATDLPLVSVIIRSMDRAVLREALDSLALQTYPHIEVLLVNARGGDHSDHGASCGSYPLRLVNAGGTRLDRSAAANAGLDAAAGQYIAFLDDDDTVDPDHYSRLVELQLATDHDAVVYAGVRCIHRDDPTRQAFHVFADAYSPARLLAGNFIPIHAPLFPARLVREGGARFDEALALYEDWDFWLQLDRLAPFVLSPRVTATYFSSGSSGAGIAQTDSARMEQAGLQVYAKWLARIDGARLKALAELYRQRHGEYLQVQRDMQSQEQALREQHRQEIQSMQLQALDAQGEIAHWRRLAGQWEGEAQRQQAIVHDLLHSTTWRMTAPLRTLLTWLKRR